MLRCFLHAWLMLIHETTFAEAVAMVSDKENHSVLEARVFGFELE